MKVNKKIKVKVICESVYDTELSRILVNWLSKERKLEVVGQWHLSKPLPNGEYEHKYCDIVIKPPITCSQTSYDQPTIIFELLATATNKELKEHFDRVLIYADQRFAGEKWVIHFTCCKNHVTNPLWLTKEELERGLQVAIVWHDLEFTTVHIVACWWDGEYKKMHVTRVEEFKPNAIIRI
ncbi:hypothetical protein RclHR1_18950004 [Rhizophagus clarus]|uniref:P-loop containing nucleoside triphosphate hydrolase protein n=1 Tax=Rhizophagus clarus TaxID=94130 RepID=A0A2Z6QPW8_9GLOM|nr:hypothetical protein RclHR1_18950004 [Rhizophagus clarus]GES98377.1 P-loop containing nucleoside triphosphate hydrolase protein [Rhizophagus clarus]